MINLLSEKDQKKLRALYFARLGGLLLFLSTLAGVIGIAFLAPPYFLSKNEAETTLAYNEAAEKDAARKQASGNGKILAVLKERVVILNEYNSTPLAHILLSRITGAALAGISFQSIQIQYTELQKGTISISGKAKTRTDLIEFGKKLGNEKVFSGVDVPLSDLVSDADIAFSLSFMFDGSKL